jgi:tetratricopeptide (TPR) repeat protein
MRQTASILVLSALVLSGCGPTPRQAPGGSRVPTSTPAVGASGTDAEEVEALAFAEPGPPAAPGDARLRELLGAARGRGREPGRLVELGQAWARRARETGDPGFWLHAGACADLALSADPRHAGGRALRGLWLLQEHRFLEAAAAAREILADQPDDATALGMLSDAELELGHHEAAVTAAQRMVDARPGLASYTRAGWLRWLEGDPEGALEITLMAVSSGDPTRDPEPVAWVLVQAATICWHRGDLQGARTLARRALGTHASFAPAQVALARVELAEGRAAEAVALLEAAHARSPLAETAWLLGDARSLAGDEAGALRAWQEVEGPRHAGDRRAVAAFLAAKGRDTARAVRLMEEERRTRGGVATEDAHAWALYRAGRLDEARAASDRATALGTPDAVIWYHAGAIRVAQGEAAQGQALIRKALDINPHFDVMAAADAARLLN